MADQYSTIQQHQPLRVPSGWSQQEKTFVVQLDEIFDDIYRRFGRLRFEDMGRTFRKRLEDDEGNIAEIVLDIGNIDLRVQTAEGDISALTISVGNLELSVADKYGKVSGITIDSSGIDISGSKTVKIESGCTLDIRSGGTLSIQSGNLGVDSSGNATLKGSVEILSGKLLTIKSGGDMNVESGGDLNVKSGGHFTVESGGDLTVNSGGNMVVSSGGSLNIKSGNNTGILLDSNGIDMQTAGKVFIHAKDATASGIIFGTDESSAKFMVSLSGDMKSESVTTKSLSVNGANLPAIVVSETQPSGNDVIWVKPSSSTEKSWSKTPENYMLSNAGGTLGWYRDYTVPYSAADYLSGNLYYGIRARLYYFANSWQNVTLKARLQNGNSWIDLGSHTEYGGNGTIIAVDTVLTTAMANIMNVNGGNFTVRLESDMGAGSCRLVIEDFILKAKTTSSGGFAACSVFYKS